MSPSMVIARRAGLLYLLLLLLGGFNLFFISSAFIVPGDAAATAQRIESGEFLYRLGILCDLAGSVLFLFMVFDLHALLRAVDRGLARLMVVLVSISVAFSVVNLVNQAAPILLLGSARALSAFTRPQLEALAFAFLRLRSGGIDVVAAFWGLWLLPFGMLVIRSRAFPRILGVLLLIAGAAAIAHGALSILLPAHRALIMAWYAPVDAVGELSIALWLLVRGARQDPTEAASAAGTPPGSATARH